MTTTPATPFVAIDISGVHGGAHRETAAQYQQCMKDAWMSHKQNSDDAALLGAFFGEDVGAELQAGYTREWQQKVTACGARFRL